MMYFVCEHAVCKNGPMAFHYEKSPVFNLTSPIELLDLKNIVRDIGVAWIFYWGGGQIANHMQ